MQRIPEAPTGSQLVLSKSGEPSCEACHPDRECGGKCFRSQTWPLLRAACSRPPRPGGEGSLHGNREAARGRLVEMKALGRGALDRTGARRRILTETSRFFVHVCRAALHVKTLAHHTARHASFFLTVLAVQLPGFRPRAARGLKPTTAPQTAPRPGSRRSQHRHRGNQNVCP